MTPEHLQHPAGKPVADTIQRLLDSMPDAPAVVLSARLDVLAMNPLGRALFAPVRGDRDKANSARMVFLDAEATLLFRAWDKVANDMVALLRAEVGRNPYDRGLSDLVGELSTRKEDFRVRWAAHDVRIHNTGVKKIHHALVGDLDLPFESLPIDADSNISLVAYLPEPGSAAAEAVALLASWAASSSLQGGPTPAVGSTHGAEGT